MRQKIPYSPLELKILENIPENGQRINTLELVNRCYFRNWIPRTARQSILDTANNLISKSDENNEDWEIFRSKARGNQPIQFWKETRKRRNHKNGRK